MTAPAMPPARRAMLLLRVLTALLAAQFLLLWVVPPLLPDGTPAWVTAAVCAALLTAINFAFWGGYVVRLVTRSVREHGREALRQERDLSTAVLDTADCLIVVLDPAGRVVRFNRAAEQVTGVPPADAVGRTLWGLAPTPDEAAAVRADYLAVAADRFPNQHEGHWRAPDGSRRLIAWSNTALYEPDGSLAYVISTGLDVTDRRAAEERLRLFEAVVVQSLDAVAITEGEPAPGQLGRRVLYTNEAFTRLTGWGSEEILGQSMRALRGPQTRSIQLEPIRAAMSTGRSVRSEVLNHHKNGAVYWAEQNCFPVTDAAGTITHWVFIQRDVTERKRVEARKAAILQAALDCIFTIDHTGRIIEVNPAAERTFGYTAQQMLGQVMAELILPASLRDRYHRNLQGHLRTGDGSLFGQRLELLALHASGRELPIELALMPIPVDPPILTAYVRDITARKRAETSLRESEERFRSMADSAPVLIWMAGTDGGCEFVNRTWLEFTGRTLVMEKGDGWLDGVHPDDREACAAAVQSALAARKPFETEFRLQRADGEYRWVVNRGKPRLLADGRFAGLIGSGIDMTERKRAAAELERAKEAAEEASRAKGEFLANMSHELRTPITAIVGYADMLHNPLLEADKRDRALWAVRRNGQHLLTVINDILDLSKIEAGRLELEWLAESPWQAVVDVAAGQRVQAEEKGLRFRAVPVGRLPRRLKADPTRLRQILLNFVSNAVKFTDKGAVEVRLEMGPGRSAESVGQVFNLTPSGPKDPTQDRLKTCPTAERQRAAGDLVFSVTDTGIGLTPEQVAHLFQPFRQGDMSTTRKYGGTGLGLSISRRLAEALGATIEVQSEPGRGSTFRLRFPEPLGGWGDLTDAAGLSVEQPTGTETLHDAQPRFRGRVLLAEDGKDNQTILCYYLQSAGLDVEVAETGRAAVEKALSGRFDVVLMDMQMPELDGYGATRQLRQAGYEGAVIALTAHAMRGDEEKCRQAGCNAYLAKPVLPERLLRTLARHLPRPADAGPDDGPSGFGLLTREYAAGLPRRVGELRAALLTGNLARLRELAHQTKGAAGMYGFAALGETAGLIEDAAAEGQDEGLIEELLDEFEALARQAAG